jgi:serine/threonine protein kinase
MEALGAIISALMSLAPGTMLGPYEIGAPLGAGGMGEVYRARDTRLERTVAVKILPQEMSNDPARKQRFEREAKTISSLNHPHICVLHDVGHQDGIDYLVMECVEGETLSKRLEKGPLPLELVLRYGAQLADALDKAHRNGVIHRDMKPGNIMLTGNGAKLLDFGLAKLSAGLLSEMTLTAQIPSSPVTQEGTIIGTFQYMSPEQVEGTGRAKRYFLTGGNLVRNAKRAESVCGQEPVERGLSNSGKRTHADQQCQAPDTAGPGARGKEVSGEIRGREMAERGRSGE